MQMFFAFSAAVFVVLVTGCGQPASSSSSSSLSATVRSSSIAGTQQAEATLSGESAQAVVAGDIIELKSGTVFVNGVSYGAIPAGAEVKYVATGNVRTLFVAGAPRPATKNAP